MFKLTMTETNTDKPNANAMIMWSVGVSLGNVHVAQAK